MPSASIRKAFQTVNLNSKHKGDIVDKTVGDSNNVFYIASTNINSLKEGGVEVEFEARKDTRSAERVFFDKIKEHPKVKLGSDECVEMVTKPDGCLDCPNFVKCMLNK